MGEDIRVVVPDSPDNPSRFLSDGDNGANEEKSRNMAAKIVIEDMAPWCLDNAMLQFEAIKDIQRLIKVRLDAGESVVAGAFLSELEAGRD